MADIKHPQYQYVPEDYGDRVLDRAVYGGGEARAYRHGLDLLSRAQLRSGLGQAQRSAASQAAAGGEGAIRRAVYGGAEGGGQVGAQVAAQTMAGDITGAQMALREREMRLRAIQAYHDSRQREQILYRQQLAQVVADEKAATMAVPGQILGMGAGLAAGAGGMASLSDVRAKEAILPMGAPDAQAQAIGAQLDREDDATMAQLRGYRYQYRPEAQQALGLPPGERYGIMAQDLEQTPLGRTLVVDTPQGKAIDGQAATGASLAMIGRLDERLRNIEALQMPEQQIIGMDPGPPTYPPTAPRAPRGYEDSNQSVPEVPVSMLGYGMPGSLHYRTVGGFEGMHPEEYRRSMALADTQQAMARHWDEPQRSMLGAMGGRR